MTTLQRHQKTLSTRKETRWSLTPSKHQKNKLQNLKLRLCVCSNDYHGTLSSFGSSSSHGHEQDKYKNETAPWDFLIRCLITKAMEFRMNPGPDPQDAWKYHSIATRPQQVHWWSAVQHPNKILNASRAYLLTSVMGSIRLEVLQQWQGAAHWGPWQQQPPSSACCLQCEHASGATSAQRDHGDCFPDSLLRQ
jgi:hypothetical protein